MLSMSICLKKVALNTRPSLVVIRSVGKATSLHTVMLRPKLMLENTAPGVAHIMALQFIRVVGKTTSNLGLENMDPGMAPIMALRFSRLVGKTTSLHTLMLKPMLGLMNTVSGVAHIVISVNVNLKLLCQISILEYTARLA